MSYPALPPSGPYYGPPPRAPRPAEIEKTNHVLHLILTLITFGMWIPIWAIMKVVTDNSNRREVQRYERESEEHRHALWEWQRAQPQQSGWGQMPPPGY